MSEENKELETVSTDLPPVPHEEPAQPEVKEPEVKEEQPAEVQKEEEAKLEEEPAVTDEAKSQEIKEAAIDEMEKASQKALEAMREENNSQTDEIVKEAEEKLDSIFSDLRSWIKTNTNPEKVKEELEKARKETGHLLGETKSKVLEVAQSEQFKATMSAGKDFLTGTGAMIGDGLKYGYDKLMEVPELKKVAEKVDEQVDHLRKSDLLKDIVANTEKGVNEFNNALFGGLRSFFEDTASKEDKKDDKE